MWIWQESGRQRVKARELKIKEVTMSDQYQNDESLELLDALEIGIILSEYVGSDNEAE
ncbi:hypothetical protein QNE27_001667 [Vibrio alginolyticus]|uniref:hypothetical protein n=1 Tax=Vibrio TaxID=662 RepID=UPI0015F4B019|nr:MULTISPECIES: hypothetical protein [Vibrio]EGX6961491.1 hypothetical protein [Vibrio alginolyticus]ELA6790436.1 hypothetical protein [Vibrio alginolyticus]ELA8374298.1 hypothetical protein [Vibrio alginolyticus]ELB2814838.1 hypothetical protein [Vibrio alginolyticus]ELE6589105.1 hypothetical protein [Vibrio alginolyticus]